MDGVDIGGDMNIKKLAKNKLKHKPNWCVKSQLTEECAELIVAINKYNRDIRNKNLDNILEEISDVRLCIEYLLLKYNISSKTIDKIALDKTRKRFPEELK
jgi:NTP pyrophosphatase (non-canonical NTP hydrolase)